jgi:hypothetical protein
MNRTACRSQLGGLTGRPSIWCSREPVECGWGSVATFGLHRPQGAAEKTGIRPRLERYCPSDLGAKGALRSCPAGFIADAGLRWCGATPSSTEWRISVSKSAKKPSAAKSPLSVRAAKPSQQRAEKSKTTRADAGSKQARVIAMLQSPTGTTIAAIMKATGWQQHSVRGFLAGVVRKRLKLKLTSKTVNGNRIYQIATGDNGTTHHQAA